jgi:hypothetical protein
MNQVDLGLSLRNMLQAWADPTIRLYSMATSTVDLKNRTTSQRIAI